MTGKPLVLDFRDPWAAGSGWSSKWRARVEGYLERKVVENASKVITVTPPILHDFVKRYPKSNGNFVLITNGFDEMDFKQRCDSQVSKRNNVNEVFSIIYTGTIKGTSASPRHFLLAVKRLIEASVIDKNQIQVRFVGKTYKDSYGKDLCEYVEAWQSVESLLATVKRYGGCIVLLWHNSHLDTFEHTAYVRVYEQSLAWIAANNGVGLATKSLLDGFKCY